MTYIVYGLSDLTCPQHADILVPPRSSATASHTCTQTEEGVSLPLPTCKAKWDIKHTCESKKVEMKAYINWNVEVHLERETRASDAPVL